MRLLPPFKTLQGFLQIQTCQALNSVWKLGGSLDDVLGKV